MTGAERDEVAQYVEQVAAALADLPPATRQELLDDLPEHLTEVLAEGGGPLTDRLGTPQAYAAELRGAVGAAAAAPTSRRVRLAAATAQAARSRLDAADRRVGPLLGHARASEFLSLLRPAWWVLRGYLAAMLLAWLLDDSGQPIGLLPRIGGSEAVALLLLAGAILGSVWLGRRQAGLGRLPRYALRSGTVLLVLLAVSGFATADQSTRDAPFNDVNYVNPYSHVDDVYVYDRHGRLLTGVRLFDQHGQPIRLGSGWCSEGAVFDHPVPTYPYCPEQAPFRMPGGGPGDVPAPIPPPRDPTTLPRDPTTPPSDPTTRPSDVVTPTPEPSPSEPPAPGSSESPGASPPASVVPSSSGTPPPR